MARRIRTWIWLLGLLIGLPLLIRAYVAEVFSVGSDSMLPALKPGDHVLVNRLAYRGLTPCWSEPCGGESAAPPRGDIIVFSYPREPDKAYIKRVIGLPGETITYHDDRLEIDGVTAVYRHLGVHRYEDVSAPFTTADAYLEEISGGGHRILERPEPLHAKGSVWRVPERHVFVLGDNRDRSNDSRFLGPVPIERIIGRGAFIVWSWDETGGTVRWPRLLLGID